MKKLSLKNVEKVISRSEMKKILGGYAVSGGSNCQKHCYSGSSVVAIVQASCYTVNPNEGCPPGTYVGLCTC